MSSSSTEKYECSCCGISTNNRSVYEKHISTKKHENNVMRKENKKYECDCGKEFVHHSSFYRHKKKCVAEETTTALVPHKPDSVLAKEWVVQLLKENAELRQMLADDRKMMMENHKEIKDNQTKLIELCNQPRTLITNTTTNNNKTTNHFNLNFFLNVQCKDAMNLSDFVQNLQIDYADIERFGQLGYAENMTRILVDGLKSLGEHRRPIHCTDVKREVLYVKDDDQWNRDVDGTKVKRAIGHVDMKNGRVLCKHIKGDMIAGDDAESAKHFKIMVETNGGMSSDVRERSKQKIVRNISKETHLDKMHGEELLLSMGQ